ncbi:MULTISPECIES: hypothetical protein [Marinobacter]|uniref:hypothetical protein n=1 Tax=Marinobacter TaxID=2742 RepID=UPI001D0786D4|nr:MULTISPECIES: hypothetical protein [Marinobacter]MCG8518648.1 hypothetical protein [Pseudomonadales bacterium]MCK7567039.1 hypothetical protein [Marinobacter xestospongiae]UDL04889.1 hypothetical protein J2887_19860 [Marinobacter sp. CA1]
MASHPLITGRFFITGEDKEALVGTAMVALYDFPNVYHFSWLGCILVSMRKDFLVDTGDLPQTS